MANKTTLIENLLSTSGVKITTNRLLVATALLEAGRPLSLPELEDVLATMDKSSIFRTLTTFRTHDVVHVIEGGRYELCLSEAGDSGQHDDEHVHFACERCGVMTCLDQVPTPPVQLPQGYVMRSTSYVVHGLCPKCAAKF